MQNAVRRYWALAFIAAVTLAGAIPSSVVYANSQLEIFVCLPDTPSTITIVAPTSDVVVDTATIEVSGEVGQASAVELYVDDVLSSVQSIARSATTYTAAVELPPGTHTIKAVAIDLCQVSNAEANVVLTYQPQALPSDGDAVTTEVGVGATADGRIIQQQSPLQRLILEPLVEVGRSLDIVGDAAVAERESTAGNVLRIVSLLTGIGLLAAPRRVLEFISGVSARVLGQRAESITDAKLHAGRFLRIIGSIIILLVFTL